MDNPQVLKDMDRNFDAIPIEYGADRLAQRLITLAGAK